MQKKTWSTHPILCVFLLCLFCTTRVGVVLEMDDYGDMVLNSISMALNDFYKPRLVLTNCDSKGDVVGAAAAAIDLFNNVEVQAIIGSMFSGQANFHMLSPFASRLFTTRDYARIITAGTTDELSSMNTSAIDSMPGVKPYVPTKTKEINDILDIAVEKANLGNPKYQEANISDAGQKSNLGLTTWSGDVSSSPKGWMIPTNGNTLKVGVPIKPHDFVRVTWNSNNSTNVEGYCIDVFDEVVKALPYGMTYEYIPFATSDRNMVGDYNDLIYQLHLENYNAVAGDVTIIANRWQHVDSSLALTSRLLLITIFCSYIFIGALLWVLEHHLNKDFRGPAWYQVGMILWFAFSTIVYAHRGKVVSKLTRLVLIIWFMVVFIPTLSYTGFFEFVRVIWNSNNTTKVEGYRIDVFNAVMASLPIGFLVEHQISKYFRHHFWHQLGMTMWFAFSAFVFSHRETVVQTRPGLW